MDIINHIFGRDFNLKNHHSNYKIKQIIKILSRWFLCSNYNYYDEIKYDYKYTYL
jgi:hypothetical protein